MNAWEVHMDAQEPDIGEPTCEEDLRVRIHDMARQLEAQEFAFMSAVETLAELGDLMYDKSMAAASPMLERVKPVCEYMKTEINRYHSCKWCNGCLRDELPASHAAMSTKPLAVGSKRAWKLVNTINGNVGKKPGRLGRKAIARNAAKKLNL